jgi:hypothetical protein
MLRPGVAGAQQAPAGRAAVRRVLADLQERGLKRPKGRTVAQWIAAQDRLSLAMAHLPVAMLDAIAEMLIERADAGEHFLNETRIINLAFFLLPPPPHQSRLVGAFMASSAGRGAWERGPFVAAALLRYLDRRRLPPQVGGWQEIEAEARDRARETAAASARVDAGAARLGDASLIAASAAQAEAARVLVFPVAPDGAASC